eukprot:TRINITY_DN34858_c0_g3_i3.p1 TRINITY_DN34858_c0_g3~~TRINITY_DN34858_c0_g3_i3.p1  ORF type:complete len:175 (-),score=10.94 TRINITY_DN34858_c0_g3_i3:288-812(-)
MKNIYEKLIRGEKLAHNQRFNFSLFLKDAGMGMEEAARFWRKSYSNIKGTTSKASLWEERRNKYAYGIQHLYGQAGSRRNYTTARCSALFAQNLCAFSSVGDIEDLGVGTSASGSQKLTEQSEEPSLLNSQSSQNKSYLNACARFEKEERNFSSPLKLYQLKCATKEVETDEMK